MLASTRRSPRDYGAQHALKRATDKQAQINRDYTYRNAIGLYTVVHEPLELKLPQTSIHKIITLARLAKKFFSFKLPRIHL